MNISEIFPAHLFWDVDMKRLDVNVHRALIIPRALIATTPETFQHDIEVLENMYSSKVILQELVHTKERISNKTCELVSKRYRVKPFKRFSL